MNDITFVDHVNGYWGGLVFCHSENRTVHINAMTNYQITGLTRQGDPHALLPKDSDASIEQLFKALKTVEWFCANIATILGHEAVHIVIYDILRSLKVTHQFDDIEKAYNLSGFDNAIYEVHTDDS